MSDAQGRADVNGEVRNARIGDSFLGIEDHGFLIFTLHMDYGDSGQGYQRILGDDAARRIRDVLRVIEVESWEQLRGKYCRVRIQDRLIGQVGNVIKDMWTDEASGEGGHE